MAKTEDQVRLDVFMQSEQHIQSKALSVLVDGPSMPESNLWVQFQLKHELS